MIRFILLIVIFFMSAISHSANEMKIGDWNVVCSTPNKENSKKLVKREKSKDNKKNDICVATSSLIIDQSGKKANFGNLYLSHVEKDKYVLEQHLPIGVLLVPGTGISHNNQIMYNGKFVVCNPNFCKAVSEISEEFLKKISNDKTLSIYLYNEAGNQIKAEFPISGLDRVLPAIKKKK